MQIAFDRVQAIAMLLSIFGLLIGLSWTLRVWTYLPALSRVRTSDGQFGPASHSAAAAMSGVAILLAELVEPARTPLMIIAVFAGFYACSLAGRWVLMAPVVAPFPIAMLAFGAAYQVTVGWVHAAEPAGVLAPLLVAEGLILAWMAIAAGRAVGQIAAVQAATVEAASSRADGRTAVPQLGTGQTALAANALPASETMPALLVTASDVAVEGEEIEGSVTQVPALPPLRAPAVGH